MEWWIGEAQSFASVEFAPPEKPFGKGNVSNPLTILREGDPLAGEAGEKLNELANTYGRNATAFHAGCGQRRRALYRLCWGEETRVSAGSLSIV